MNTHALTCKYPLEQRLFTVGCCVIALSLLVYAYAVTATIFNIASVKGYDNAIGNNRGDIGQYESRYLEIERGLTIERAEALGLVHIAKTSHLAVEEPTLLSFSER